MSNLILLYENASDEGTLMGGSWGSTLSQMQDPRPTSVARSTNALPASTTWQVQLTSAKTFKAIVFGPTNFSSGASYRIRAYSDSGFSVLVDDSSTIVIGSTPQHTLDMHWTDAFWWSGAQPIEDPGGAAGGIWVIHVYSSDVTAQYWQFDLANESNPDGYVQIGRLFMGTAYVPSLNMTEGSGKAGFESMTPSQRSAGGTIYSNRRRSARTFEWQQDILPDDEVLDDVYRLVAISGTDQQVFVIPDPDDSTRLSKRSFLGNLSELPSWTLDNTNGGSAATGFKVVEAL